MYKNHFGFEERPFKLLPDPAYLFVGDSHEKALAHLIYTVTEGDGICTITGATGTGKTTLCRAFMEKLDDRVHAAYIYNPELTSTDLLKAVCDEFGLGVPSDVSTRELIDDFKRFLVEKKREGKHVVLIVDEAQSFNDEALEQIRLLSNMETSKEKLLQIVLVGQMELDERLNTPELKQLQQRITLRCQLLPLTFEESVRYIQHRVKTAMGKECVLFNSHAFQKIYGFSQGVPRLINMVCDKALLCAFVSNREKVCGNIVDTAIRESLLSQHRAVRRSGLKTKKIALIAGAVCSIAALIYVFLPIVSKSTRRAITEEENNRPLTFSGDMPGTPEASGALPAGSDRSFSQIDDDNNIPETQTGSEGGSISDNDIFWPITQPFQRTPEVAVISELALDSAPEAGLGVPISFFKEVSTAGDLPKGKGNPEESPEAGRTVTFADNEVEAMVAAQNVEPLNANTVEPGGDPDKATVFTEQEVQESDSVFENKVSFASAAVTDTDETSQELSDNKKTSAPVTSGKDGGSGEKTEADEKGSDKKSVFAPASTLPENKAVVDAAMDSGSESAAMEAPVGDDASAISPSGENVMPETQTASEQKNDLPEEPALALLSTPDTQVESRIPASDTIRMPDMESKAGAGEKSAAKASIYKPDEVDEKPKLIKADLPIYPKFARRNKINGWVVLQFVVDDTGRAKKVEILEEEPVGVFKEAALDTVEDYRFKPAEKDGKDVNCILKQRIRFELD